MIISKNTGTSITCLGLFERILDLFGTLKPKFSYKFRRVYGHLHPLIIELPEIFLLKEISFLVVPLEHSVNVVRDSPPHHEVPGVVQLHVLLLLVKPPVHCSYNTESLNIFIPSHRKRELRMLRDEILLRIVTCHVKRTCLNCSFKTKAFRIFCLSTDLERR